jgi:hypothetical protein
MLLKKKLKIILLNFKIILLIFIKEVIFFFFLIKVELDRILTGVSIWSIL